MVGQNFFLLYNIERDTNIKRQQARRKRIVEDFYEGGRVEGRRDGRDTVY